MIYPTFAWSDSTPNETVNKILDSYMEAVINEKLNRIKTGAVLGLPEYEFDYIYNANINKLQTTPVKYLMVQSKYVTLEKNVEKLENYLHSKI